ERRFRPRRHVQLRVFSRGRHDAAIERRLRLGCCLRLLRGDWRREQKRDRERATRGAMKTCESSAHGLISAFSVNGSVTTVLLSACDARSVLPSGTVLKTTRALPRY